MKDCTYEELRVLMAALTNFVGSDEREDRIANYLFAKVEDQMEAINDSEYGV